MKKVGIPHSQRVKGSGFPIEAGLLMTPEMVAKICLSRCVRPTNGGARHGTAKNGSVGRILGFWLGGLKLRGFPGYRVRAHRA